MITGTFKFYKLMVRTIRGEDSPKQIAFGVALGAMAGLIPPSNLLAILFATLILATRVNMLAAILSGFAFVWLGYALDPLLHRLGAIVLLADFMSPVWATLHDLPVVPWTKFNNTVVMGSLALGLALFYPLYFSTETLVEKYGPKAHQKLMAYRLYRKLAGQEQPPVPEGSAT